MIWMLETREQRVSLCVLHTQPKLNDKARTQPIPTDLDGVLTRK